MAGRANQNGRSKRQDVAEFRRWHAEGVPYKEMVERYKEKYNLDTRVSMFTNWAAQLGLPKRSLREQTAIPWDISEDHRNLLEARFLGSHARELAGLSPLPDTAVRYEAWKKIMDDKNWVVHYDPETEEGFFYMDRRPGIDFGYVRTPDE